MNRLTRDEMWLNVASVVAKRGNCLRRQVGCVITDINGYILSTGYNGVPAGFQHCDELKCSNGAVTGKNLDSCNALHAEQNAIARLKEPLAAHNLYCTTEPCVSCLKLILATNIKRVVFLERYENSSILISNLEWIHYGTK